jgi:predicted nucleic acid-binding protein
MRIKAVLDAQILVRGILRRRTSAAVKTFDHVFQGSFDGVVSRYIIAEVAAALKDMDSLKKPSMSSSTQRTSDAIDVFVRRAEEKIRSAFLVSPGLLSSKYPLIERDERDTPLVEACLETGAKYLVSEDRGVLAQKTISIAGYHVIQVLPPQLFLKML